MQPKTLETLEEKEWRVHPYSKRELAVAYAPEITPEAAVNRLMSWIRHHPELYAALLRSGYLPRQRLFNAFQVDLIFRFLGKP